MNFGTITSIQCEYINDASQSLGNCAGAIPSSATGVRVTVQENHPTFFIKVVPGGPSNVTTSAVAAANIRKLPANGRRTISALRAEGDSTDNGQPMDIVNLDSNYNFDRRQSGRNRRQVQYLRSERQGRRGLRHQTGQVQRRGQPDKPCMTAPNWCDFENGNVHRPVNQAVDGI